MDLVRISPQYPSLSLEVTGGGGGASDETSETEVPGQSSCGTIKILPAHSLREGWSLFAILNLNACVE